MITRLKRIAVATVVGTVGYGVFYNINKSKDLNVPKKIDNQITNFKCVSYRLNGEQDNYEIKYDLYDYFRKMRFREKFDLNNKVQWYRIKKLFTSNTVLLKCFPKIFTSPEWIDEANLSRRPRIYGMNDLVAIGTSFDDKVVMVHNGPGWYELFTRRNAFLNPSNYPKFKDSFSIPRYRDVYVAIVEDQAIVDEFIKSS